MSAVDDLASDRLKGAAGALLVGVGHGATERGHLVALNQVDGGTAETASGEAGSEATRAGPRQFDQQIQLRRAVQEMVAGAFMALEHVLAELFQVSVAQSAGAEDDALNFTADVVGALKLARGEFLAVGLEQGKVDGTK
jgi:hypothetical protein